MQQFATVKSIYQIISVGRQVLIPFSGKFGTEELCRAYVSNQGGKGILKVHSISENGQE